MTDDSGDKTKERADAWESAFEDDLEQVENTDADDDESEKVDEETQHAKDTMEAKDTMDTTATEGVTDTQDEQDTHGVDVDQGSERSEWDVDSISSAWRANQVRLPESIQGPFDTEHKRLDFQLEQLDADVEYSKDRHYKPLVVALGLRELQNADADEIADLLDQLEGRDLLE